MSGAKDLQGRATDKMKRALNLLDEYESGIGLPKHKPPGDESELDEYFTMDRTVIESMTAERCASYSYRLAQFSFYLQREMNREEAKRKWAKSQLDVIIAKELNNYDKYTKYDAKVALICADNSYAQVLSEILEKADGRVTRLTYLSSGIKNLSDSLGSVGRAKAAKKYE